VKFGEWIGKVSSECPLPILIIYFNPHGHGTHTECLGHITRELYSINQEDSFFHGRVSFGSFRKKEEKI
jgi:hypothetical protein